jgi:zinc transport system substrate-binding protein
MRKFTLIILALLSLNAFAVETKKVEKGKKPVISVSILPQKFFVEQIAGDFFDVNVILPPGSSPEDYEPTPRQIMDVSNSKIFFYVGHLGFEKSWLNRIVEVAPSVIYISCSKKIDLLREGSEHDSGEPVPDSQTQGTDPHIWTSPENVKIISRTICSQLSASYPDQKVNFEKNLKLFISKIDTLDNHIRRILTDSLKTSFMIFHPALGYFARDYHLVQHSIEFDGKSPSTAHMKQMVDIAKSEKINTIFIQSQFEIAKAEAIAKEIGAKIVPIDNLAENWLSEMYSLTDKMKIALSLKVNGKTN